MVVECEPGMPKTRRTPWRYRHSTSRPAPFAEETLSNVETSLYQIHDIEGDPSRDLCKARYALAQDCTGGLDDVFPFRDRTQRSLARDWMDKGVIELSERPWRIGVKRRRVGPLTFQDQ